MKSSFWVCFLLCWRTENCTILKGMSLNKRWQMTHHCRPLVSNNITLFKKSDKLWQVSVGNKYWWTCIFAADGTQGKLLLIFFTVTKNTQVNVTEIVNGDGFQCFKTTGFFFGFFIKLSSYKPQATRQFQLLVCLSLLCVFVCS